MTDQRQMVSMTVNGKSVRRAVEPRLLLCDFLREELRLTGTHVGCSHGVCGACTVMVNGQTARSCLAFAVQMDGATIETVESLAPKGPLSIIQEAFHQHHALQCGFCTPGLLMRVKEFLQSNPDPTEASIRTGLAGHLCRCTGYVNIVRAVRSAAETMRGSGAE